MIYVGLNIFPGDDPASVTYYFQDTVSYFNHGPVTDPAHDSKAVLQKWKAQCGVQANVLFP
jgi:hypothetical protein